MTSDLDIYRAAKFLIDQYGEKAPIAAALGANAMLEKGDLHHYAIWKRILLAMKELQDRDPAGPGKAVH